MRETFVYNLLLTCGRGVGQVMFQNNALSGLLMLLGIFFNSWQMGVWAILGNMVGTLTALWLDYDRDEIKDGLYGFNGTLVGIAVGVFMPLSVVSLLGMVLASALSTLIAHLFKQQHLLPGFTAPFILAVWLLLGICKTLCPEVLYVSEVAQEPFWQEIDYFQGIGRGIGQVMFQESTVAGILFLLAICIHSRSAALYTLWGAFLSIPFAVLLGVDGEALNAGLMGYNGVLCAIALGDDTFRGLLWASCGVLLAVILQIVGMKEGFVTLTAPFVLSVWLVMGVQKVMKKA